MWRMLFVGPAVLLVPLTVPSLDAQDRPHGFGLSCGGFGSPAVEIVVEDSSAARGGRIAIARGAAPEEWKNGHAVELWRGERLAWCASSIGTTEVRAPTTDGLRVSIGASQPVEVTIRSRAGRQLARAAFLPASREITLSWQAAQ